MKEYLQKFVDHQSVQPEDFLQALRYVMDGNATESETGAFLLSTTFLDKNPDFIHACAKGLYERVKPLNSNHPFIMDVCGTGGDYSNTFNISTAVALLLASGEVPIAKHGNRAVSSLSGSADVLESLKIPITNSPEESVSSINDKYFTFLFAPAYHSSMKHLAKSRKDIKVRTMFNIIGPLVNPFNIQTQIIGIANPSYAKPILKVAELLGRQDAVVVHGYPLDELSLHNGYSSVFSLEGDEVVETKITAESVGLKPFSIEDIRGGDAGYSADIIRDIASKKEIKAKRDVVALNAAVAFYVSKKVDTIKQGVELSLDLISQNALMNKIVELAEG